MDKQKKVDFAVAVEGLDSLLYGNFSRGVVIPIGAIAGFWGGEVGDVEEKALIRAVVDRLKDEPNLKLLKLGGDIPLLENRTQKFTSFSLGNYDPEKRLTRIGKNFAVLPAFCTLAQLVSTMPQLRSAIERREKFYSSLPQLKGVEQQNIWVSWDSAPKEGDRYRPAVYYFNSYASYGPDSKLLNTLDNLKMNKAFLDVIQAFLGLVLEVDKKYVLSKGSLEGQFGRIMNICDNRDKLADKLLRAPAADIVMQLGLNKAFLPDMFAKLPHTATFRDIIQAFETASGAEELDVPLLKFAKDSDAGIFFGKAVQGEVMVQQEIYASLFYAAWKDPITRQLILDREEEWRWVFLCKLKPKLEVYTREKAETRSRNICSFNTFVFFLVKVFLNAIMLKKKSYPEDTESHDILKFTPFHGGMDELLNAGFATANKNGGMHWVVYSDNVYIFLVEKGKRRLISADVSAMESHNSEAFTRAFMERILEGADTTHPLYLYLTQLFPIASNNSLCVLGSNQFRVPGWASGSEGTFMLNTAYVISVAGRTLAGGLPFDTTNEQLIGMFAARGLVIKVESVTDFPEYGEAVTGDILRVDLLGFDAFQVIDAEGKVRYLPILSYDRLCKAIMYDKVVVYHQLGAKALQVYRYLKFRGLYLMGAWAHPVLAVILFLLCTRYAAAIGKENIDVSEQYLSVMDESIGNLATDEDTANTYLQGLMSAVSQGIAEGEAIPSAETLARLCSSKLNSKGDSESLLMGLANFDPKLFGLILKENYTTPTLRKRVSSLSLVTSTQSMAQWVSAGFRVGDLMLSKTEKLPALGSAMYKFKVSSSATTDNPMAGARIKDSRVLFNEAESEVARFVVSLSQDVVALLLSTVKTLQPASIVPVDRQQSGSGIKDLASWLSTLTGINAWALTLVLESKGDLGPVVDSDLLNQPIDDFIERIRAGYFPPQDYREGDVFDPPWSVYEMPMSRLTRLPGAPAEQLYYISASSIRRSAEIISLEVVPPPGAIKPVVLVGADVGTWAIRDAMGRVYRENVNVIVTKVEPLPSPRGDWHKSLDTFFKTPEEIENINRAFKDAAARTIENKGVTKVTFYAQIDAMTGQAKAELQREKPGVWFNYLAWKKDLAEHHEDDLLEEDDVEAIGSVPMEKFRVKTDQEVAEAKKLAKKKNRNQADARRNKITVAGGFDFDSVRDED